MADLPTSTHPPEDANITTVSTWKRRVSELEEEIEALRTSQQRRPWVFKDLDVCRLTTPPQAWK